MVNGAVSKPGGTRQSPRARRSSLRRALLAIFLRRRVPIAALAIGLLTGAPTIHYDFDDVDCEAAMGHLADCCPDFFPEKHYCGGTTGGLGCRGGGRYPDLSAEDSQCVIGLDCQDIRSRNLCAAVDALPANVVVLCPGGGNSGCGAYTPCGPPIQSIHPRVCN